MTFLTLFVNMYLSVIFKDNVKLNLIAELVITAFVIIPFTMGKSLFFMSFLDPELKVSVASMMDGYKYIIKLIPYIILELLLSVGVYFVSLRLPPVIDINAQIPFETRLIVTVTVAVVAIVKLLTSFTTYILCEDNKISGFKALIKSIKLTFPRFFYIVGLTFSFMLWYFLIPLTSGLIVLYLIPYTELTMIMLYKDITEEKGC